MAGELRRRAAARADAPAAEQQARSTARERSPTSRWIRRQANCGGRPAAAAAAARRRRMDSERGAAWSVQAAGRSHARGARSRATARRRRASAPVGGIALVVALAAYPVVRGLTRRLERLQPGVDTLGAGDLSARVSVEGRDEVARLPGFNRAADRIEELMARIACCSRMRRTSCARRSRACALASSCSSRPMSRNTRLPWNTTSRNSI